MVPWEQSSVDEAIKQTHRRAAFINKRLEGRRYLVGDSATIADAFLAAGYWRSSMFVRLLSSVEAELTIVQVLDDDFRAQYPNLQKWFEGVAQEKAFKSVIGEPEYAKKAPSGPPKKG